MRIIKDEAVAVIIDIQEKLAPVIEGMDELVRNTSVLIRGMKILEVPVLLTEQYPRGLGKTTEAVRTLLEDIEPVEKITFSCCDEPLFMKRLDDLKKRFVILAGIETHVCVLQTCVDLLGKNYIPVIVVDCIASRTSTDRQTALQRMQSDGALLTTCESILFELCRVSGTDKFKAISKLVKYG